MLPEDFRLATHYGRGVDWPLSYDELEPYYAEAETLMQISGPSDDAPSERSRRYPLPPHDLSQPERLLRLTRKVPLNIWKPHRLISSSPTSICRAPPDWNC